MWKQVEATTQNSEEWKDKRPNYCFRIILGRKNQHTIICNCITDSTYRTADEDIYNLRHVLSERLNNAIRVGHL